MAGSAGPFHHLSLTNVTLASLLLCSYAFKKDTKGERHGTPAERLLAAQVGACSPLLRPPSCCCLHRALASTVCRLPVQEAAGLLGRMPL